MPNIYEALQKAQEGQDGGEGGAPPLPPRRGVAKRFLVEKLVAVSQAIDSGLPQSGSHIVMFTGTNKGEGTSTAVRSLAEVASSELGKRVALVDANPEADGHAAYFGVTVASTLSEAAENGDDVLGALVSVQDSNLCIGHLVTRGTPVSRVAGRPSFGRVFEQLRSHFDLVLLDAPPAGGSSDALLLTTATDGVILVIQAERTRWQVTRNVRDQIEKQGGTILGVLLNKRKFYIPRFIYKRL